MASFRLWPAMLALLLWAAGCTFWQNPQGVKSGLHGLQGGEQVHSKSGLSGPTEALAKLAPKTPVIPADDPISLASKATPSAALHVAAARMSEQAGHIPEAQRHYQEALKADARHAGALVGLARLKDRQGETAEATALYRRAAKARPNEASIANDLGLCLARHRKYTESITAFEQAIRLDPKKPLYRNNIAMVLVEKGEIDAAVKQLTALQGEAVAHYNVGYILQKKGDSEAAAAHFAKALQENPSLAEASAWLKKLGKQPASIADSTPRIAAGRQFHSPSDRTPVLPAPAGLRGGRKITRGLSRFSRGENGPVPPPNREVIHRPLPKGEETRTPATPFLPMTPESGEPKATVRLLPPLSGEPPKTYPRFDRLPGGSPSAEPAPLPPPRPARTRVQPLPPVTTGDAKAGSP